MRPGVQRRGDRGCRGHLVAARRAATRWLPPTCRRRRHQRPGGPLESRASCACWWCLAVPASRGRHGLSARLSGAAVSPRELLQPLAVCGCAGTLPSPPQPHPPPPLACACPGGRRRGGPGGSGLRHQRHAHLPGELRCACTYARTLAIAGGGGAGTAALPNSARAHSWQRRAATRAPPRIPPRPICPPSPSRTQVWKDGSKVEELVGAAKDKLKALVEKYV